MADTYDSPEDFSIRGPSYQNVETCKVGCSEGCMNNDPAKSAQPCGCDEGAKYLCYTHRGLHAAYDDAATKRSTAEVAPQRLEGIVAILAQAPTRCTTLPTDPAERKKYPIATGFIDYFPDAIAAVAHVSWVGNNQHNPGQPLHWARGKSMDQDDTAMRHMLERGGGNVSGFDVDGLLHRAKQAWRTLAALQLEIEDLTARGLYPPKEGQ